MTTSADTATPRIGPVATHLLFENEHVKVWQMNTPANQSFWHHYHHHDYVLFYTTDVLAIADQVDEQRQQLWQGRFDHDHDHDHDHELDAPRAGIMTYAHSVFFIPGTGFLSPGFTNLGPTPFVAPLIEILRPRRPDQQELGFVRSDALVGLAPRSGRTHLLENDRLRVCETALAPGQSEEPGPRLDAAVYVIDGGPVTLTTGTARQEQHPASHSGHWRPGTATSALGNHGSTPYRELSVELK